MDSGFLSSLWSASAYFLAESRVGHCWHSCEKACTLTFLQEKKWVRLYISMAALRKALDSGARLMKLDSSHR